jgi:hypothetical protein
MNSVYEISNVMDYNQLDLELLISAVDNTLTEARYDEIINLLAQANLPDEIFAQAIFQGKTPWQQKHWKRYGFTKGKQLDQEPRVVQEVVIYSQLASAISENPPQKPIETTKTRVHH